MVAVSVCVVSVWCNTQFSITLKADWVAMTTLVGVFNTGS